MNNRTRDIFLGWLAAEQLPAAEEVKKQRRRQAYEGNDDLAQLLMKVEKNIENSKSEPLRPLRDFFRRGPDREVTIEMEIAENELFPAHRRRICELTAEKINAKLEFTSKSRVRVTLPEEKHKALFCSLYNWELLS